MEVPMPSSRYDDGKTAQFWKNQLLPAVQALPGVEGCGHGQLRAHEPVGLGRFRFATRFGIEGRAFDPGRYPVAQYRWVTPEYFHMLGIPLRRGRVAGAKRDRDKPRYLINETLARQFFPGEDPTTHRLIMGVMDPRQGPVEIAGVVGDVRDVGLDEPAQPALYMVSSSPRMTLLVKTAGDPMALAAPVRDAIHRADPEVAVLRAASRRTVRGRFARPPPLRPHLARRLRSLGRPAHRRGNLRPAGLFRQRPCSRIRHPRRHRRNAAGPAGHDRARKRGRRHPRPRGSASLARWPAPA